jgi:hypothetical protein
MNEQSQRVAIAKACGYKMIPYEKPSTATGHAFTGLDKDGALCPIPDYLHDLNAMHEAEKTMTGAGNWILYVNLLRKIMHDDWSWFVCAPANVRAEAFLRVIRKWEDEP